MKYNCEKCEDKGEIATRNGPADFDWEFCTCVAGQLREELNQYANA